MPYVVLAASVLPGTELVLTVSARRVPQFADPAHTRVLAAPREIGELHFYSIWHPRLDDDPSHRQIVRPSPVEAERFRRAPLEVVLKID
jgi:hypothetical protein